MLDYLQYCIWRCTVVNSINFIWPGNCSWNWRLEELKVHDLATSNTLGKIPGASCVFNGKARARRRSNQWILLRCFKVNNICGSQRIFIWGVLRALISDKRPFDKFSVVSLGLWIHHANFMKFRLTKTKLHTYFCGFLKWGIPQTSQNHGCQY